MTFTGKSSFVTVLDKDMVTIIENPKLVAFPLTMIDKITPEFPLAPTSMPKESSLKKAPTLSLLIFFNPDSSVSLILVPVSPSGTGNTFKSLIFFSFSFKAFKDAFKHSFNVFAFTTSILLFFFYS